MKIRHLITGEVKAGGLYRIPAAPANVMLDVTSRCNRRCRFCYLSSDVHARPDPDTADLIAIVTKLALWGVPEVLYLGGEPTLHRGFRDLLKAGARLGLVQRVITHGGEIDTELAAEISRLHVETGVSLHSVDPRIHDELAGVPGAFEHGLKGVDALVANGAPVYIAYSPTRVDRCGLIALGEFLRTRYSASIRFIDVNRLLPYGRGGSEGKFDLLDEEKWWGILCEMAHLIISGIPARVESVPRCWVRRRAREDQLAPRLSEAILGAIRPCYMGITQLAFDLTGHIKLCPGGPAVGPSILDVDPAILWRTWPGLIERRAMTFLPRACVDFQLGTLCDDFYLCGGGCRSAAGTSPHAPDPLGPLCQADCPVAMVKPMQ